MSLSLPNAIGELAADSDAPYFEVTWTDPVTRTRGFLVLDRLVRGISSGGLRMRAGCSLSEVRGLARGMTLKEAGLDLGLVDDETFDRVVKPEKMLGR